jgi:hypothetical protein
MGLCAAASRLAGGFAGGPTAVRPAAVLRVGLAALLLVQGVALAPCLDDLFGPHALVRPAVADRVTPAYAPRLSWLASVLAPLGVGGGAVVRLVLVAHLAGALAMLAGWRTRAAVLVTWLTYLMYKTSAPFTLYGANEVFNVALLYCVFLPTGAARTRLGLRVLQTYLAFLYLSSGVVKACGAQWWNGEALWRTLTRTDFSPLDFTWLAQVPWLAAALCWGTVALEVGYAAAVCVPRLRRWWVLSTVLMHLGIAVALNLWLFSALMILLNACAWLVPADVRRRALPGWRLPAAAATRSARPSAHVPVA